jgi:hypothetical protein
VTLARISVAIGAWGLLSLALWVSDAEPAVAVLAGVAAAIAVAGATAFDLAVMTSDVKWRKGQAAPPADQRATKLQRLMNARVRYDSTELEERLVALVDDRLLANKGIDRASMPEAAAEVLTPRLRDLVAGRRRGIAVPRELQRILTDIEDL